MYHKRFRGRRYPVMHFAACICAAMIGNDLWAQDHSRSSPMAEAMRPFWLDDVMHSEPVLFIRDESTGESQGSLLFPAERIIAVTDSTGSITYEPGVDFRFNAGSREIIVPPGSRIVSKTAGDLRRPANSQKYKLTHRDGGGEILFGAKLEYHEMQTSVWEEFLKRKKDADLTGNGVNHPNDFGHRVYAQVIAALLLDPSQ
jgi:acyl-CoA thioesterase-1